MLQPKEYDKLLGILETSAETKEVEGIRSVIKHIPDLHIAGDLDPRVLKVISSYTNHSEEEQTEPANVSIAAIRASMGWLNRDVTTTEITTELLSIPSKEHDIPARIYRPISNELLPAVVFFHHHELIKGVILALAGSSSMLNKLYLQGADVTDIRVSPLLADDLNGLPETLIINAEYDYLRLQAEAYARKLARSGVKTKMIQYKGMDHAFIDKIGDYPQAEDCMNEIAKELKSAFRINC